MGFEWVLGAPVMKTFKGSRPKIVPREVRDPQTDLIRFEAVEIQEAFDEELPATVVRVTSKINEAGPQRLLVRFIYGRLDGGAFRAATTDTGVVFSGVHYIENAFATNPAALEDENLLPKIAEAFKWGGSLRSVSG